MKLDRCEVLRYLRMGSTPPDAALTERIDAHEKAVLEVIRPAFVADLVEVGYEASSYSVGPLTLSSKDLRRTLRGAAKAYLFAATLGLGVDQLLRRAAATGASDHLIVQALATTAIEQYVDAVEKTLIGPRAPRFSPGYGDLPLAVQREFIAALDARKRLGITLTDTCLMLPSKSVTAIIGVLP